MAPGAAPAPHCADGGLPRARPSCGAGSLLEHHHTLFARTFLHSILGRLRDLDVLRLTAAAPAIRLEVQCCCGLRDGPVRLAGRARVGAAGLWRHLELWDVALCQRELSHMVVLSERMLAGAKEVRELLATASTVSTWAGMHGSFSLCVGDFFLDLKRAVSPDVPASPLSGSWRCLSEAIATSHPHVQLRLQLQRVGASAVDISLHLADWDEELVTVDGRVEVFAMSPQDPSIRLHVFDDHTGDVTSLPCMVARGGPMDRLLCRREPVPLVMAIHCMIVDL